VPNKSGKFMVYWSDEGGGQQLELFDSRKAAQTFMINKLSSGYWACFPEERKFYPNKTSNR